jgi:hypothetical protein
VELFDERFYLFVSFPQQNLLLYYLLSDDRFAPVTIMTGVYGMNVSQISGTSSNPNIWQFFVAVAVMNVLVVIALGAWYWISIQMKHGRSAGLKEVLGFAVGAQNMK